MREIFNLQHTFDLWIAGLLVTALLIQGAKPRWFASTTSWAFVAGWQREIACFDLTLAWLLLELRGVDAAIGALIVRPFVVLWLLLGANHFVALVHAPRKPGHWAGVLANASAVSFPLIAWALH